MKVLFKILKVIISIVLVVALLLTAAGVICRAFPGKEADYSQITNPHISVDGKTLVSAHRSGGDIAPENTLAAFKNCIESEEFNVDIYEFDLHITADGKLILLHDSTLDRTTNAVAHFGEENVAPSTKTYAELRELNFGENFEDVDGNYPYRGLTGDEIPEDLRAVLLEDVLDYLESNGSFDYIIEIKDSGENGFKAADELYRIISERDLLDNVVFGTFNMDVTNYVDENYLDMLRSAGIPEVILYYFMCAFGIEPSEGFFKYEALQIPMGFSFIISLDNSRVINYAHRNNIAVQYWTINDAEDMELLKNIGADCIMSDNPALAYEILNG